MSLYVMSETSSELVDSEGEVSAGQIILGLGNPGERYVATRHNVGFRVVEELARRRHLRLESIECNSLVAEDNGLLLVAPQTFMNRSGYAARCLQERRGVASQAMLIVYDEIHLSLGTLRLRPSGSPAGHRGLESILESLGTDQVPRLRLGVSGEEGPPAGDRLVEFVLEPFREDEKTRLEAMILRAADACEAWASEGAEMAMQRFNGPPPD